MGCFGQKLAQVPNGVDEKGYLSKILAYPWSNLLQHQGDCGEVERGNGEVEITKASHLPANMEERCVLNIVLLVTRH